MTGGSEVDRAGGGREAFLLALADTLAEGAADEALAKACELMGLHFGCNRVGYGHLDYDRDMFSYRICWTDGRVAALIGELPAHLFGTKIVEKLSRGETVVIGDLFNDPLSDELDTLRTAADVDTRAILVVPFLWAGALRTIVYLNNTSPRAWTVQEVALMEEVAERTRRVVELAAAEARLREREARFSAVFSSGITGLTVFDARIAETLEANDHILELTGYTRADFEDGRWDWEKVTPPEYLPLDHAAMAQAQERGWFDPFEKEFVRSDGTRVPVRLSSAPLPGHPGQVVISVEDMTERKAAEAALRELNATLEARVAEALAERRIFADLVERTDAFVQVADLDYRWLAINRAAASEFERIFGVRPKVGDSMLELLAAQPDNLAAVKAVWSRALGGEEFTEIGEFGDPARDRRAYEMKYNVLRDAEGRQIGAFQFVYDVTDRVREQRRLVEAEEQLRQSQKMEAMGQLTGGVAHDFNNLLTPIIGSLDLLRRKAIGGEREQRLIAGALQSADRARTLVQRLLAFARRQALQPVPVDIGAAANEMADLIASTMGPQIRVTVEAAEGTGRALADRNQLEMALINLCVNARDAMPDGGTIRISVAADRIAPGSRLPLAPGDYVRLSVADSGIGMDEATRARAIEPFFSTKGVGKGTGLGLSMVHGLAQQLGGAMTLDSRPGVGTNVQLWLPSTQASPDAAVPVAVPAAEGRRGLVLLVDDEEGVRASAAEIIEEFGYEVIQAASAEAALALIGDGCRPAIVVTDHLMPGVQGAELARRIRARPDGCPVLIVSGYADADSIDPGLPRLAKPFRADELIAAVEDALRR